ncbi:hypothetical protein FE391_08925 [Nonomuraea sp. KC401]|uniref:hypothetical protein n=1 Tax=unclassified Nonomuraea TaxID=2593643 RepID=UPI0010FE4292|nr:MULTISPECIES: hypothetical protein [unclassified Nonomuraea]NBE93589.1 hypothetical protein [Nonomuraea sp. K271]TLF80001.1 hypothetical protein FE391_08925 [Nonomuraea sp. KC401]
MTTEQDLSAAPRTDEAREETSPADTPPASAALTVTARSETARSETARPETTPPETTPPETTPPETTPSEIADARGTPGDGAPAGRFGRVRVLWTLTAMVVAVIAATAVLQGISAAQARDARAALEAERALRLEVSGAAGAFSKALLSYDYQNLQTTRSSLAAQATGDFLSTYDAAFGGAMAQVIVKLKATSQATVREVYLADVDEATAHAIVVVDQQVNTSEAIRSVKDSHLKISLVKEKGTWKIHDVTVLGASSEDQYTLDGDEKKKD